MVDLLDVSTLLLLFLGPFALAGVLVFLAVRGMRRASSWTLDRRAARRLANAFILLGVFTLGFYAAVAVFGEVQWLSVVQGVGLCFIGWLLRREPQEASAPNNVVQT